MYPSHAAYGFTEVAPPTGRRTFQSEETRPLHPIRPTGPGHIMKTPSALRTASVGTGSGILHHPVPKRPIQLSNLTPVEFQPSRGPPMQFPTSRPAPGPLIEVTPLQRLIPPQENSMHYQLHYQNHPRRQQQEPQQHQPLQQRQHEQLLPPPTRFNMSSFPRLGTNSGVGQAIRSLNQRPVILSPPVADHETVWQVDPVAAADELRDFATGTPAVSDTVVADDDLYQHPSSRTGGVPPLNTLKPQYPTAWNPTLAHYTATKPRRLTLQQENSFEALAKQHIKEDLLDSINVVRPTLLVKTEK